MIDWITITLSSTALVLIVIFVVTMISHIIDRFKHREKAKVSGVIYVISKNELKDGSKDECYLSLNISIEELKKLETTEFDIEVIK